MLISRSGKGNWLRVDDIMHSCVTIIILSGCPEKYNRIGLQRFRLEVDPQITSLLHETQHGIKLIDQRRIQCTS